MNKRLFLLSAALLGTAVHAQAPATGPSKIALLSLIGDYFSVEVYRIKTGSNLRRNETTRIPLPSPLFDHTALQSLESSFRQTYPQTEVAMLAIPKPDSEQDPHTLLHDAGQAARNPLVVALRAQGYSHLVAITKLRAEGRVPITGGSLDAGSLSGLGFFIDPYTRVTNLQTLNTGTGGYIAPYVHIKLSLLDTATGEVVREHKITTMRTVTSGDNATASDAWSTLSSERKVRVLQNMIRSELQDAAPQIVARSPLG